ncbi:MAG: hypothetical protein E6Q24_04970 [Chitinophagaceae bacterium]|nr:MAG: hypothetical protein E6Q24_04970 [Chitinophagaceae bacterium]
MKYYKYKRYKVRIQLGKYPNCRLALELRTKNSEPVCVATVNIPGEALLPGEIIIKNWGENEGILKWLQSQGIISAPKRKFSIGAGFTYAYVVDLLKTDFE